MTRSTPDCRHPTDTADPSSSDLQVGQYLLTEVRHCEKTSGEPYMRLVLDDAQRSTVGFLWAEHMHQAWPLTVPAVVQITGRPVGRGEDAALSISTLQFLHPASIDTGIQLLPIRFCPKLALQAFASLMHWERTWPVALRRFVGQVLVDPEIGIPFLRTRAAGRYHHAYRGGLLQHSAELLDLVPALVRRLMPDCPHAVAVTQVAALFHDLGKIHTVGQGDGQRPVLPPDWAERTHEALSLKMLTPHLKALSAFCPETASVLFEVFTYLSQPHATRGHARSLVIDIVRFIDQMSTALDRGIGYWPSANHAKQVDQGCD
jgi:hypothetical protein